MSLLLAALSAGLYGLADFTGAVATRRAPVFSVVLVSQTVGLLVVGAGQPPAVRRVGVAR
jgi:hypothetical protein